MGEKIAAAPKGKGAATEVIHEKSFTAWGTAEDLVYSDKLISGLL